MRAHGNQTQWEPGDRPEDKLLEDIRLHQSFVGVDDADQPHFAFVFIFGADPTYKVIEQGSWLNDEPYGTIHRLGSDGTCRGVFDVVSRFCEERVLSAGLRNLRGDTHADNYTMRHVMEKSGFIRTGTIHVSDGTPRIAYQKVLES